MPEHEKSPLEYALLDGDTGEVYEAWDRVWRTPDLMRELYRLRCKPVGLGMRSVVVHVRKPGDTGDGVKIDPSLLLEKDSTVFYAAEFPRRSGRRGQLPG